jgi:dUTP pyrophosphatase
MDIGIELMIGTAKLPVYSTEEAAGADLCSAEAVMLLPNEFRVVRTGLRMDIPKGYHVEIRSRSGLAAKHGVFVLNSPGTVDSDYTGEVGVILCNVSQKPFIIAIGDRIAQMVVMKHETVDFHQVVSVDKTTERGSGGFGHTGV